MKTIFINIFGGPGAGKSTTCASIFHRLKVIGVDVEMALEYAKDAVWEESYKKLDNQIYIFGKQHHRLWRLNGKVQVVITDSPIINSIVYDKTNNKFLKDLVISEFKSLDSLNYHIVRDVEYNPNGRMQTLEQALQIDEYCIDVLNENQIAYTNISKGDIGVDTIINQIFEKINEK